MKRLIFFLTIASFCNFTHAQSYPFQDTGLTEDQRIRNLISLMTLDEKLSCLSTRLSIPRLGVAGTRTIEGLHGLAYSGPANWVVKGPKASYTTTFPQADDLCCWDTNSGKWHPVPCQTNPTISVRKTIGYYCHP